MTAVLAAQHQAAAQDTARPGPALVCSLVNARRARRRLLEHGPDSIHCHFLFCEFEDRMYRSRDVFASALAEYDDACVRHDGEMDGIGDALLAKFGKVPVLETYRQMAVRQQKVKDWQQAIW